jgi:hypothetical protein
MRISASDSLNSFIITQNLHFVKGAGLHTLELH